MQHKPWFDEGCSKSLDHRKQPKLQWLQDPSEINVDNQNNARHERREYLKDKLNELAVNIKNNNI
jgi:hypothetical protein